METTLNLRPETVSALQSLIQINIDSAKGFREAAEDVSADNLKSLFLDTATMRDRHAAELQEYVRLNAVEPEDSGSLLGTLHRWWLDARAALTGGDPYSVLAEVERGEDAIKARYEKLLPEVAGNALSDVLHKQMREVKSTHDRMRDTRDRWA